MPLCFFFIFWSVNVPNTDKTPGDFRIRCTRKKDFVAANIAAVNLPLFVCSDPNALCTRGVGVTLFAAQIAALSVCIEQYISTGSKAARYVS